MTTLRNYIGGEWIAPGGAEFLDLTNPASGEPLGKVPLSGTRAVNEAVAAAQTAFLKWREVPPVVGAPAGVTDTITRNTTRTMGPRRFCPNEITTGKTCAMLPHEKIPLSAGRRLELAPAAGSTTRVLNLAHGGTQAVNAILKRPG